MQEWISIDDSSRMAAFGTKTCEDPSLAATLAESSAVPTAPTPPIETSYLSREEEDAWRESLGIGSLIDARDRSGGWFQACIMDLIEVKPDTPSQIGPVAPSNAAPSSSSTPSLSDFSEDSLVVSESEDSKGGKDSVTAMSQDAMATLDDTCSAHLSDAHLLSLATGTIGTDSEEMTIDHQNAADDFTTASNTSLVSMVLAASAPPPSTKMARVAFLGWPEWYDEWVCVAGSWSADHTQDRTAPINTKSNGNRGEYPVREEIKLLANFISTPNVAHSYL